MTPEEAAIEIWRLVGLPKRIFIARAVAILQRLLMERRPAA